MMKIINLAHGEFMMLGAYATVLTVQQGVSIWIAMLIVAPVFVGLVGLLVERVLIRFLYGRMIDTMLATWGLSLGLIGLTTTIFGNDPRGVSTPVGGFSIGHYEASLYGVVIIIVACGGTGGNLRDPAADPLRADRAGNHAERQHGGGARRCAATDLHDDLRAGGRVCGPCRRRAGADLGRFACHGHRLCRQGLHHRPGRRRGDRHGNRPWRPRCSASSTN